MGGGVGEAMLLSAVAGAGTSAVTGGDPLKGALIGAATGGIGHGLGGALGGQAATTASAIPGAAAAPGVAAASAVPSAFQTAVGQTVGQTVPSTGFVIPPRIPAVGPTQAAAAAGQMAAPIAQTVPQTNFMDIFKSSPGGPGLGQRLGNYIVQNPNEAALISGGLGGLMIPPEGPKEREKYSGPLSRFSYDPDKYRRSFAGGGIADLPESRRFMRGGHLGSYSDGGRLLKGPGDGMSDDIPAKIGERQPARLADGEFVVPADVVSGLGNGSTDAGAKKLYAMMDKVRQARTGRKSQGKEINPNRYMPA